MPKRKNKGVSMVEILIAIAIFSILMVPIVSSIISSMHSTTTAKELQYRNEYVENLMEYVKEDSIENILKGDYFSSIGTFYNGSQAIDISANYYFKPKGGSGVVPQIGADSSYNAVMNAVKNTYGDSYANSKVKALVTDIAEVDDNKYFEYEEYNITGKVTLGTEHTPYVYKMMITSKPYAEQEKADEDYVNPNNLALGVVEDIDYNKIALINGTIANYDSSVLNTFLTKKIEALKEVGSPWYDIYMQQSTSANLFPDDTATRKITVSVSGSADSGYTVMCNLNYHDNCESRAEIQGELANEYVDYYPFEYNYPGTVDEPAVLPNIYLMYNCCLYNKRFSPDDYIILDTSGVTDDTPVNFFIVQTAERYSENLVDANDTLDNTKILYNDDVSVENVTHSTVNIHMVATKDSDLSNVSIYYNFDKNGEVAGSNKKSQSLLCLDEDGVFDGNLSPTKYKALDSAANIGLLGDAKEENRGLYEVKVWIQEGDDPDAINMNKNPTITATKGGSES